MEKGMEFLPVSREEMIDRGWYYYDFLVVTADGYIDHPSFGTTLIARLLESRGYRVAILPQPDWHSAEDFRAMGNPRYGVLIGGGNLDSMVAHYTVAKRRRTRDLYSEGGEMGKRPDRPTIVYANRVREAWPDVPIVIGGLEASLRRFAHYDYWDDKVRRSILFDAPADLLVYGMGESATAEIARRLARKIPPSELTDIPGTAYITDQVGELKFHRADAPGYEAVCADKAAYARATKIEYDEHDPIRGCAVVQPCEGRYLVVNPPARPLRREELDALYALPYTRQVHPMYKNGIPAIEEVQFSITHNRGCFGADGHQPIHRVGAGGGGAADPRAGVQGVHPRRGRAKRQLPPHQLPEAEAVRYVQEPQLPGAGAVPQSGRGPLGVHGAAAADAGDTGDQAGVRAERHPVRLYAAGQGQVVL